MFISHTIASIILHVVLLATFIGLFYFLYATGIERRVITSQVDRLILDITSDLKIILSDTERQKIAAIFTNLTTPDMSAEDQKAAKSNAELFKKASLVLGLVFVIGISAVIILSFVYHFSLTDMLKESAVILITAAATEFVFLSFFARNYRSLDPNMVKSNVVKAMQIYAQS